MKPDDGEFRARHMQSNLQAAALGVSGGKGGETKNKQRSKRPKQNWAVRRPIVTKRSTAKTNAEEGIPPAMSRESIPHPRHVATACDTTQTTWRFGNDWQHALLVQAGLNTRVTAAISFLVLKITLNTLVFWTPRSGLPNNIISASRRALEHILRAVCDLLAKIANCNAELSLGWPTFCWHWSSFLQQ